VKLAEVMEKLPAEPEVLEISASLEPEASLTTEAVTPRLSPLMVLARWLRLSAVWPVPVGMVTEAPAAVVRVKDEDGRVAVALAAESEYHAPVLARLLTTIVWVPVTVPVAAVADAMFALDEVTDLAARGPVRELSACISFWTAWVAVWIVVKAVVWLVRVVWSACQPRSGARSAKMAAATAAVTSIPGVVAPVVAARIELILTVEVEGFKIEDVLIMSYLLSGKAPLRTCGYQSLHHTVAWGTEYYSWRNEGEVEPRGLHLSSFVGFELRY